MDPLDAYRAMTPKARREVLLAEYRCRERCLLLHIWQTPQGRNYYQPPYRLSPTVTDSETVESARAKRTVDGSRRWRERAGSLDELIDFADGLEPKSVGLTVTCDHVRETVAAEELADTVAHATPGRPAKVLLPRSE